MNLTDAAQKIDACEDVNEMRVIALVILGRLGNLESAVATTYKTMTANAGEHDEALIEDFFRRLTNEYGALNAQLALTLLLRGMGADSTDGLDFRPEV